MSLLHLTGQLRFERRKYTYTKSTAPPDPMHVIIGKRYEQVERTGHRFVLQQEFRNVTTGESTWRDVPSVAEPTT